VRLVVLLSEGVIKERPSDLHVASTGAFLPDAWSSREGNIALSAGKETFQALGLPGVKLASYMPAAPEQYRMSGRDILRLPIPYPTASPAVINVSMSTPNTNVRSHDFILDSFDRWDQSRGESGEGQWDFAFHMSNPGSYFSLCALQ